jgi:protein-tyrosine phosphatase
MLRVLFVCTGNRCRSPFAGAYFALITRNLPVEVLSAGTLDAPGNVVPQELIEIGHFSGLDLSSHRSRALVDEDYSEVDLVIGFERTHVAAAVVDAKIPHERAFTLPEIVRLLSETDPPLATDPVERARSAVAAAAARRAENDRFVPDEEIADPFRRSMEVYRASADDMVALCNALYLQLFGEKSSR